MLNTSEMYEDARSKISHISSQKSEQIEEILKNNGIEINAQNNNLKQNNGKDIYNVNILSNDRTEFQGNPKENICCKDLNDKCKFF